MFKKNAIRSDRSSFYLFGHRSYLLQWQFNRWSFQWLFHADSVSSQGRVLLHGNTFIWNSTPIELRRTSPSAEFTRLSRTVGTDCVRSASNILNISPEGKQWNLLLCFWIFFQNNKTFCFFRPRAITLSSTWLAARAICVIRQQGTLSWWRRWYQLSLRGCGAEWISDWLWNSLFVSTVP